MFEPTSTYLISLLLHILRELEHLMIGYDFPELISDLEKCSHRFQL